MASRPKRVCTQLARERIARILEWESCSESSSMFKTAAARMEREFEGHAPDSDYEVGVASSSEEDDAMDEDSSEHSPPSSACGGDDEKNVTDPTLEAPSAEHAPVQ